MPVARNSKAKVSSQDKKDAPVIKRGRGRPAGDGASGPRKAKKDFKFRAEDNLKVYIFRVLRDVHPEVGISKSAMTTLNSIILEVYRNLASNARELCHKTDHKSLTSLDIQTATKIVLPGELCKHAVSEGARALTKYNATKN